MAQQNWWEQDKVAAPASGGGPQVIMPAVQDPLAVRRDQRSENADQRASIAAARSAAAADRAANNDTIRVRGQSIDNVSGMRKEFTGLQAVKDYNVILPQITSAMRAAVRPNSSGADDLSLIYTFGKVMDPGSVVREAELAMAQGTGSWAQNLEAAVSRLKSGEKLPPAVRHNLIEAMRRRGAALGQAYNQQRSWFEQVADRNGFNPDDVVGPHPATPFQQAEQDYLKASQASQPGVASSSAGGTQQPYTFGADGQPLQNGQPAEVSPEVANSEPYREAYKQRFGEYPPLTVGVRGGQPGDAPTPSEPYQDSLLSAGLTGINNGAAGLVGLPVDVLTGSMNLGTKGFNALTNADLPMIERPVGGSESIRDAMAAIGMVLPVSDLPGRRFVSRVGESVGANALPIAGTATTLGRAGAGLLASITGGIGGATAQQVAPGNRLAEMAAEVAGGAAGGFGMFAAARRNAGRQAAAAVPSIDQLKAQASQLYTNAESRGVVAGPNVTTNLAERVNQIARDESAILPDGTVTPGYESIRSNNQVVGSYAGGTMSAKQIDRARRVLAGNVQRAGDASERRVARMQLDAFDAETLPLAPEFTDARNVSSRYLQAEEIGRAADLAEVNTSTYTQSGLENATRNAFRALDRNIAQGRSSFSPQVETAISRVNQGDTTTNVLRGLGKAAPRGNLSTGISVGVPFAIGSGVGGPLAGGLASGATIAIGEVARRMARQRTLANASAADLIARNGGSMPTPTQILDAAAARQIAAQSGATINNGMPVSQPLRMFAGRR